MAKVSIVFEEQDNAIFAEPRFNVYLDGLTDARRKELALMSPEERREKASTVEFWAFECFRIVGGLIQQAGALTEVIPR